MSENFKPGAIWPESHSYDNKLIGSIYSLCRIDVIKDADSAKCQNHGVSDIFMRYIMGRCVVMLGCTLFKKRGVHVCIYKDPRAVTHLAFPPFQN